LWEREQQPTTQKGEQGVTTGATHDEYADEAAAAQRAEAWPQAAALWRRATDTVRAGNGLSNLQARNLRQRYERAAAECEDRQRVEQILEEIAKTKLRIPTLRERDPNQVKFCQLSTLRLREALLAAYQAGRTEHTPDHKGR
jgi:hypothetical protein